MSMLCGSIVRFCFKVITHPRFDQFILFLILISSITLAVDEPRRDPDSGIILFVTFADNILAILFAVEMCLKLLAWGVVAHKVRMLLSFTLISNDCAVSSSGSILACVGWNILDGIIVIVSLINISAASANLKSLRCELVNMVALVSSATL